ncbi:hypothetical protein V8F33_012511 [Rhypophila sp. PSN 637]
MQTLQRYCCECPTGHNQRCNGPLGHALCGHDRCLVPSPVMAASLEPTPQTAQPPPRPTDFYAPVFGVLAPSDMRSQSQADIDRWRQLQQYHTSADETRRRIAHRVVDHDAERAQHHLATQIEPRQYTLDNVRIHSQKSYSSFLLFLQQTHTQNEADLDELLEDPPQHDEPKYLTMFHGRITKIRTHNRVMLEMFISETRACLNDLAISHLYPTR